VPLAVPPVQKKFPETQMGEAISVLVKELEQAILLQMCDLLFIGVSDA